MSRALERSFGLLLCVLAALFAGSPRAHGQCKGAQKQTGRQPQSPTLTRQQISLLTALQTPQTTSLLTGLQPQTGLPTRVQQIPVLTALQTPQPTSLVSGWLLLVQQQTTVLRQLLRQTTLLTALQQQTAPLTTTQQQQ